VKESNRETFRVAAAWVALSAALWGLRAGGIFGARELLLVCVVFYVLDIVFVLFWCPFRVLFMKNRCCTTCRIYNWDFAMMFTPLVFIPHIYTWSLLLMGLVLLLRWEVTYYRHPERFSECSNSSLSCANCQERLCNQKKSIRRLRIRVMAELKEELGELKEDLGELRETIKKKTGR
jgi:hypothetical protein